MGLSYCNALAVRVAGNPKTDGVVALHGSLETAMQAVTKFHTEFNATLRAHGYNPDTNGTDAHAHHHHHHHHGSGADHAVPNALLAGPATAIPSAAKSRRQRNPEQ